MGIRWRNSERVVKCRKWKEVLVVKGEGVEEEEDISASTLGAGAGEIWT